jgi:hypothetical protein
VSGGWAWPCIDVPQVGEVKNGIRVFAVALIATAMQAVLADDRPATSSYNSPSKQQVLAFLIETVDWYHRLSLEQQIATEPDDMLFLEDNRPISAQVVRFSFDFARAVVAFEATVPVPADPKDEHGPAASGPDFQRFVEMEAKSQSQAQRAADDLKSLQQKRLTASRAERKTLEVEIDDAQSRLTLLQAISGSLQNLREFSRATDAGLTEPTNLEAFVDSLERTVPEVSSGGSNPTLILPSHVVSSAGILKGAPSGILGQISDVSTLAGKRRTLDESIALTDKLIQSSQQMQRPLAHPLNEAFRSPDLLAGTFTSNDLGALRQQEVRLKAFTVETAKVSPAVFALAKQRVLLTLFKSHLVAWRASVASQYRAAWKKLILHLIALGVAIAFLIGAGALSRRVLARHIHDFNSRRMLLLGQRVLFWLALVLIVSFAFAFSLSSLATFLGLLSAGIAVALQNVIVAVAGYFLLVGKLHIRIGDRVQISGVTGEVVDIGLMQFQLRELDTPGEKPTGRVVSFSNSFVFVSPATGLFKRIHGSTGGQHSVDLETARSLAGLTRPAFVHDATKNH